MATETTKKDTGTAAYDVYTVQRNDALELYAMNLWARNPELQKLFPAQLDAEGKVRVTERGFPLLQNLRGPNGLVNYFVEYNNNLPKADRPDGWQKIVNRDGTNCDKSKTNSPQLHEGQVFVYKELPNEIENPGKPCEIIKIKVEEEPVIPVPPPQPAPPPVPERIDRNVVEDQRYEYLRQDSASQDGKIWRPGTTMHALETLARTRNNSAKHVKFQNDYYNLVNVAARHPEVNTRDTGEVGGEINGMNNGDHVKEGDYVFGEDGGPIGGSDGQSKRDDRNSKRRDGMTGPNGTVGKIVGGPRQPGFVTGHTKVLPDGSYERLEDMPIEFAYRRPGDAGYAYNAAGVQVPLPIPAYVPVGALDISPQRQEVLSAETRRWGISTSASTQAIVNEAGKHNAFRDQQTTSNGPMESPDRIYAYAGLLNSDQQFIDAMRAFDEAKTPEDKQLAAAWALTANRDARDNILVKRVDAGRIPREEEAAAVRNYFQTQGVDLAKVDAVVATAPRLRPVDMDQDKLEGLQGYKRLVDSRYAGINPGKPNPALDVINQYSFRTMNAFEAEIADGKVAVTSEAQHIQANREAAVELINAPGFNRVFAQEMQTNENLGVQVVNLLRDMPRNYKNYGFKSRDEALEYTRGFVGEDKAARQEIERRGTTAMLPVLGYDDAFGGANPDRVLPLVAAKIEANPALAADLLNRATDPALGVGKGDRGVTVTDGRVYGKGIMRALAAQILPEGAKEEDLPKSYSAFASVLGGVGSPAEKKLHKAVAISGSVGEEGQSNVGTFSVQSLDNNYRIAQLGERARNGQEIYAVLDDANAEANIDAIRKGGDGKGGDVLVVRTTPTGMAIFNAAREGKTGEVYNQYLASDDARSSGRDRAAVASLRAHDALARDAVLVTILRDPHSLDGPINDLAALDASVLGDKYGELKGALIRTRELALKGDVEGATRAYAGFFANMGASAGKNVGSQRANAWNNFLIALGDDATAASAVIQSCSQDSGLRTGVLKSVPEIIAAAGNNRQDHGAHTVVPNPTGDDVYTSRFFTLATDAKGNVRGTGLFGGNRKKIGVDTTGINSALQGNTDLNLAGTTLSSIGVTLAGSPVTEQGAALNTNPVIYTGSNNVSPVTVLSSWLQAQNIQLPANVTYDQLAAASLQAGLVKVTGSPTSLQLAVDSEAAMNPTLAAAGQLAAAPGISAWWLAFAFKHPKKQDQPPQEPPQKPPENPPIMGGQVPNCVGVDCEVVLQTPGTTTVVVGTGPVAGPNTTTALPGTINGRPVPTGQLPDGTTVIPINTPTTIPGGSAIVPVRGGGVGG